MISNEPVRSDLIRALFYSLPTGLSHLSAFTETPTLVRVNKS